MRQNILTLLLVSGLIVFSNCGLNQTAQDLDMPSVTLENFVEIKESPARDEYGFNDEKLIIKKGKVKRNESLYLILRDLDVSPQKIQEISQASKGVYSLNTIRPGQKYQVYADKDGAIPSRMILNDNLLEYVVLDWENDVVVKTGKKEVTTEIAEASGVITSSLYETLIENEDNTLLANRLSEIFAWQIDFFRIYKNDSFKVIYEQQFVDGEPFGVGKILAAEFSHKGQVYDAFYYETDDRAGYFDSEGRGVQKALLKAPFRFSQRISSGFSSNRFHPVLKRRLPHYGVDYAAPLGTPVISVGDGEVLEAQYRGANGNIVKIRHNSTYTTAYLHLNGFASGIKKGVKVRQGQVIGYVGKTGRVTGVHLDYRIYKNNSPVNPLHVELPPSKSLAGNDLETFKRVVERYRFELDQVGAELVAMIEK
tara:strand:+ start:63418 stop:64689 length:1272 start_codon:yes stop_codon:yes gene_type:complete